LSVREIEPDAWDGLLDRVGLRDAYLRRGYVEASCVLDGGRPTLLHDGGDAVFACSVRSVPASDRLDVITPYGYGGPLAAEGGPLDAFWAGYEEWCAERSVVSTFVRFHPLYRNHLAAPAELHLERLADTVAWPVGGDADPAETLHRHHRRRVRKAEGEIEVVVRQGPARLDEFAALYEEGMKALGAASFYLFPREYWDRLAALGDGLVQVDGRLDGELVAGTLCLASPPWLHYHLGAALGGGRSVGASHLLLLSAARWGHEHGCDVFHLGGGVGGSQDSLWEYKTRFAPDGLVEAWVGKAVHDEAAYLELSGAETLDLSGFFPAYRAPQR
jgi:hypothetical protein